MEHPTRIFIDTSKQVFQLHGVNAAEQVVLRRKLRRSELLPFLAGLPPALVGLEACGGSHHWAREIRGLGHEAKLVPPQYVKAYVKRGKNDARDAEGGCEAISRPTMRYVPVTSAEDQAVLMLLGVRDRLVRNRTQLSNAVRGHAAEFGLIAAKGLENIGALLARASTDEALPQLARALFADLGKEYAQLQTDLAGVDKLLMAWHRGSEVSCRLAQIPGLGPIGAVMLTVKTPDPHGFRSARDYAAWIGLTPKDHSTAGKARLGVITKAGDEALRAVLVAGAMAVVQQAKRHPARATPWLAELLKTKDAKHAAVALANRTARIAWKLMVSGQRYDPAHAAGQETTPMAA